MWSWSGQDWVLLTGARLPAFPGGAVTDTVDGHVVVVGSLAEPVLGAPAASHLVSVQARRGVSWGEARLRYRDVMRPAILVDDVHRGNAGEVKNERGLRTP